MGKLFAAEAWLGPGGVAGNVLITFDTHIHEVLTDQAPPEDAGIPQVDFLAPGFINAHCHLEYTHLAGQMPRGAIPFGEWMTAIVGRGAAGYEVRRKAMADGARQLVAGGCTMVLDSSTDGYSNENPLRKAGLRHLLLPELLGLTPQRAEPMLNNRSLLPAELINPHAPYSVGPWLRGQLAAPPLADIPQAWHLAESADEDELFRTGKGSIAEFYQKFGMPFPFDAPPGKSPFEFLQDEGLLDSCAVAFHGNGLSREEARHFAAPRAMVHCPATHRWFERAPAPLEQWLQDGVNVGLGTDSLASSDTLSMLEIVRMTAEDHPGLTTDDLLTMVCTNPAKIRALSAMGLTGTIEAEAPADFTALRVTGDAADIFRQPDTGVAGVWVRGKSLLSG